MGLAGAAGGDGNQAVRVCKLCGLTSTPVCNLLVGDSPVHSIVALLQGTQDTELMPAREGFQATRALQSRSVKCLLGEQGSKSFNLMAYCPQNPLLVYKLDDDMAVVLISGVIVEVGRLWQIVCRKSRIGISRPPKAGSLQAELSMSSEARASSTAGGSEPSVVVEDLRSLKRARTISKWPSSPAPTA